MPAHINGESYPMPSGWTAILLDQSKELRDQSRALGRIESRLEQGDEFHDEMRGRVTAIETRVTAVETKRSRALDALEILRKIASLKEWAVGLLVVILAAKGFFSPGEVKAWLLNSGGLP